MEISQKSTEDNPGKSIYHNLLKLLIDTPIFWDFFINQNGKFTHVSPECYQITGYKESEFICNPGFLGRLTTADFKDLYAEHEKIELLENSEKFDLIFKIITKSGCEKWIHHKCYPVFDRNGIYLGRIGTNADATETKKLLDSMTQHDPTSLFEEVEEGLIYVDRIGKVLYTNSSFTKITGLEKTEVIGCHSVTLARKLLPKKNLMNIMRIISNGLNGNNQAPFLIDYGDKKLEIKTKIAPGITGVLGIIKEV